ncbi:uncharacterized protein LOC134197357 isoform X2 [Corticium candelabrum]|uniref:uncharacterized protein LOC134197357 isoform X2 n=1 Tax=Corticium candelabrum TaxID=121492 RepID=UPI002E256561|nr:uncharacterized protein LOC134197357 isoform X2 [Corticium candelabrum]
MTNKRLCTFLEDVIQPSPVPFAESPPKYCSSSDLVVTPEKEKRQKPAIKSKPTLHQQREIEIIEPIPLGRPRINSSIRIVTSLNEGVGSFSEQQAVETLLKEERARHEFIHKSSKALNYPHHAMRYSDLTPLQLASEDSEMRSQSFHHPRQPKTYGRFSDELIYEVSDSLMDVPLPATSATPVHPDSALQLYESLNPTAIGNGTT